MELYEIKVYDNTCCKDIPLKKDTEVTVFVWRFNIGNEYHFLEQIVHDQDWKKYIEEAYERMIIHIDRTLKLNLIYCGGN